MKLFSKKVHVATTLMQFSMKCVSISYPIVFSLSEDIREQVKAAIEQRYKLNEFNP